MTRRFLALVTLVILSPLTALAQTAPEGTLTDFEIVWQYETDG